MLFLILNLVFSALIFAIFGYYILDIYDAVASYFHLSNDQSQLILAKFRTPIIVGAGLIALFIITTLSVSIKYTHQIYGPLVSIHRFLDNILEGRRGEPLHLRESDQLKDLATKLNIVAELLGDDKRQTTLMPVYRFLDELLAGQHPQALKLRDSDQLQLLSEKLNALAAKIGQNPS